ncbi:MAG: decaprenyl-phosphate phosphoribosyltransferase [Myxococcota bacterium]|nr:decaprenyl-phosphate phosphoribosyltransferase [Myxococcota bacterium]
MHLLSLARPKQWVKNIFVFTALIFSGKILDGASILNTLIAFVAFCLASSSVYFINDYRDIEEDSQHPEKKHRPLASDALPRWVGLLGALLLCISGLAVAGVFLNRATLGVVGLYLGLNIAYSFGLKHLVIIDVLVIAAGFVLRILAGAVALTVMPSAWLLVCAVTISLFLGFTKRRAEVVLLGDRASDHRKVLSDYSPAFLDQMVSAVTAATIVAYVLYTVDERTVSLVGSRALLLSVPLVLYGIFRYLYLVYHTDSGGDPTRTVITDIPLIITVALWSLLCATIILVENEFWDFTWLK